MNPEGKAQALDYLRILISNDLASEDRWFQGAALRVRPGFGHLGENHPASCLVAHERTHAYKPNRAAIYMRGYRPALRVLHDRLPIHLHPCDVVKCLISFNNNADSFEDVRLLLKTTIADLERE